MKFDFNKNIIINESEESYKALLKFYKKTGLYKKAAELIKKYQSEKIDIKNKPANISINNTNINSELNNTLKFEYGESFSKEFSVALHNVCDIHDQILDMYTETLYEDNWDDVIIEKFENLLSEYNKNIEYIKNNISKIEWKSQVNKDNFKKYFDEVLLDDANNWNRVQARHSNYLRYRTNRKSIILQIANIIGGIKNTKDGNLYDIFKYYNDKCAKIKLYDNSIKTDKKPYLAFWFKPHLNEITDELQDLDILTGSSDARTLNKVFNKYVKCRKYAYAIFNLMTSNDPNNGYDKWHNQFINYCDANISDKNLEQLINAVTSEKFEEFDDLQNLMDEESWERKEIYESFDYNKNLNESWFDDEMMAYYKNHKERYNKSKINKINMVPTNANQCRVYCDGNYVYANATFYPGDIIEICPTKKISKDAMYSKDMREAVFEVIPNEDWVLPFGYCRYYLHNSTPEEENCLYIWDPIKRVIVIKAINKIPKYSKLFLKILL